MVVVQRCSANGKLVVDRYITMIIGDFLSGWVSKILFGDSSFTYLRGEMIPTWTCACSIHVFLEPGG